MKKVPVADAVGHVLCHDITKIIPGEFKGAAFKKGHIIRTEDIPELLKLGKEHLYVWEAGPGQLHENEAAVRMARAAAGSNIQLSEPSEGKVNLLAGRDGLLKVDTTALLRMNSIEEIMMATLHNNRVVSDKCLVAGTRIIPLVVDEEKIVRVEAICREAGGIISIRPFKSMAVGVVVSGSEVYKGRIQDAFGPVVRRKVEAFGCRVVHQVVVPDDQSCITAAVNEVIHQGAEMVLITGGMSVDPDDLTPAAVKSLGASIVTYGAPVLPGAMFLLAYLGEIPVMGLPGCVMYAKTTVFDLVLPRVLTGEKLTREDIVALGHGGLCLGCPECRFPHCPLGKGA
ncbi:molybdopterin-binding protein [Desulfotomaculum copahuensis]|uniref:Molybdopterin molybdenumtransferase n=1 Tax=Desulfotomaculum copahuensis TaxID=1838280 RepID=A0A1B7LG78_9FIRM|nr:molybdopterin-binding protein [Desulfotomaculum copahuensis]OAT84850.1 molybdopterin-binding protein [Desulfotomaculum copahuensis]